MNRMILCLALLIPAMLFAQPVQTIWTSPLPGTAYAARELPDGGLIIAGDIPVEDYPGKFAFVTKLAANGDMVWTHTFGRIEEVDSTSVFPDREGVHGRIVVADGGNHVRDIFALSDGSLLLATGHKPDTAYTNCRCLIHVSANGDSLGCRYFCTETSNIIFSMNQTPEGELIAFGNDELHTINCSKFFILRLNAQGDTLALQHFERDCHSCPTMIVPLVDGECAIAGTSGFSSLARLNAAGNLLWGVCSASSRDASIAGVCAMSDGGLLTYGATFSETRTAPTAAKSMMKRGGNDDSYLVRYSATGDTLWQRVYSGAETNRAIQAIELQGGRVLVAGMAGVRRNDHPFLLCTSADGDSLWTTAFEKGEVCSLTATRDGGCLLVTTDNTNGESKGMTTVTKLKI